MANVLLTNVCNRRCNFCFAGSRVNVRRGNGGDGHYMSREKLGRIMGLLERSGEKQLRLLGGEPTLHPEVIEIVRHAVEKGFHVHVFSNGIMRKEVADYFATLSCEEFSLLCNISPQVQDGASKVKKRNYALSRLAGRAQVGMTLTEPEFDVSPLIDTVEAFGLRKRIRIGIAQPIVGKDNCFLQPSEYRRAGRAIVAAARQCIEKDILLGFDCGLTLCMFDEAEIGYLMKNTEGFVMRCSPILDIGSNLDIWHCFPLSEVLNTSLNHFAIRNEIVSFYNRLINPYRSLGCKPECIHCPYLRRGQCSGGCLAHAMRSLNKLPERYAHPPQKSGEAIAGTSPRS